MCLEHRGRGVTSTLSGRLRSELWVDRRGVRRHRVYAPAGTAFLEYRRDRRLRLLAHPPRAAERIEACPGRASRLLVGPSSRFGMNPKAPDWAATIGVVCLTNSEVPVGQETIWTLDGQLKVEQWHDGSGEAVVRRRVYGDNGELRFEAAPDGGRMTGTCYDAEGQKSATGPLGTGPLKELVPVGEWRFLDAAGRSATTQPFTVEDFTGAHQGARDGAVACAFYGLRWISGRLSPELDEHLHH